MKKVLLILIFSIFFINPVFSAVGIAKKDLSVTSCDGFNMKATLEYKKVRGKKDFHTVVLLHSLGYSSEWWDNLPKEFLDNGYAVLKIDLRGHGRSVYNSELIKTSWKSMTNAAYAKYPQDVASVIEYVKAENPKKNFFNEWAIVGADIGASAAILASDEIPFKPDTMVFLSPVVELRGLYVPVKLANLDFDIFSISGTEDFTSANAEKYLSRFTQKTFATYTSSAKSSGMLMLKHDKSLSKIIYSWIKEYL